MKKGRCKGPLQGIITTKVTVITVKYLYIYIYRALVTAQRGNWQGDVEPQNFECQWQFCQSSGADVRSRLRNFSLASGDHGRSHSDSTLTNRTVLHNMPSDSNACSRLMLACNCTCLFAIPRPCTPFVHCQCHVLTVRRTVGLTLLVTCGGVLWPAMCSLPEKR